MDITFESPAFTEADAVALAGDLYRLRASAEPLPSERDRNFLLVTPTGDRFVLKIANAREDPAVIDLQDQALAIVGERAPAVRVPKVQPTRAGRPVAAVTGADGVPHLVRLLTWVPGRVLAHVAPHTPDLLRSLGAALAHVDRALVGFDHPAAHRRLKWDLARAAWIRDYTHAVDDPRRRAMVERIIDDFEARVAPRLPRLRQAVVYNDANDHNVVVDGPGPYDARVVGLIDFGDMVHTCAVADLAIGIAYAILGKPAPVEAAGHVVGGYHGVLALCEDDLDVLDALVRTRLAVSVVNAAWQRQEAPGNDYLTISERPAWEALERLAALPVRFATYAFRQACGLPPCPAAPRIVAWLERHGVRSGPLLDPDPRREGLLVFDFGVGSPTAGDPRLWRDPDEFGRVLAERMRRASARVGVGRYDEARPFYDSAAFRCEGNEGPEWRTVHLGLDLFAPSGTAVLAPFDGVVHSVRDNAGPLDYGPTVILEHRVEPDLAFFTLYGHLGSEALALSPGASLGRGQRLAGIGAPPGNGGWAPHLHFQIVTDLLGRKGEFPGVALPRERGVWLSLSPDPNLIARLPAECRAGPGRSRADLLAARTTLFSRNLSVSYREPLTIVRGYMQHLYDEDGRRYLDAVNNVPHVGHSHPRVVEAARGQMSVLNTNTRYLHELLVRYAERLTATLPEPLRVCFFVNSGSEANELALRLARTHTGRHDMVVVEVGYHGNTTALIEVSAYKFDGPGGQGAPPWIHKVPIPDTYRGLHRRADLQAGAKYAGYVGEAVASAARLGGGVAGFICESILSAGGQVVLPDGYLAEAYRHVRAAGGVCIADEVQVGFGRDGTHFWAFEAQGVVPDIVTMGKPIGNGHPLGAVVTTPAIAASFANGMEYFSTFGGNPVSCAVGLAVLDVIAEERLQARALATGKRLSAGLRSLMERHPLVGDVRGPGLFVGVELVRDRASLEPATGEAACVANRMRDRGVLVSTDGPFRNVLKIKPPMVFDEDDADRLVATLDSVLGEEVARR